MSVVISALKTKQDTVMGDGVILNEMSEKASLKCDI